MRDIPWGTETLQSALLQPECVGVDGTLHPRACPSAKDRGIPVSAVDTRQHPSQIRSTPCPAPLHQEAGALNQVSSSRLSDQNTCRPGLWEERLLGGWTGSTGEVWREEERWGEQLGALALLRCSLSLTVGRNGAPVLRFPGPRPGSSQTASHSASWPPPALLASCPCGSPA